MIWGKYICFFLIRQIKICYAQEYPLLYFLHFSFQLTFLLYFLCYSINNKYNRESYCKHYYGI